MRRIRRNHEAAFKAKVVLETLKENRTLAELASEYKVHPNQISKWKQLFQNNLENIFAENTVKDQEAIIARLYEEIGRLKVEIDYLKKRL
jgi:transposase